MEENDFEIIKGNALRGLRKAEDALGGDEDSKEGRKHMRTCIGQGIRHLTLALGELRDWRNSLADPQETEPGNGDTEPPRRGRRKAEV